MRTLNVVSIFDNQRRSSSEEFLAWIEKHQEGFFINTYQQTSARYLVLHRATCGRASPERYGPEGATQGRYKKICSVSYRRLYSHLKAQKVDLASIRYCKSCSVEEVVRHSRGDALDEASFMVGEELELEGRRRVVKHLVAERSGKNRAAVLRGRRKPYVCDACDYGLSDYGREYEDLIHVHHARPVARGVRRPEREDFLLLCPNCHAVAHWRRATKPLSLAELRAKAASMRIERAARL